MWHTKVLPSAPTRFWEKKYGARRVEPDGRGDGQQEGREQDDPGGGYRHVEGALEDPLGVVQLRIADLEER